MLNRLQLTVSLTLLVFFGSVFFSITYSHISIDAPYYLSVARDIALGYIPYKDIYLSYTPLVMYINSLVYLIFEGFNYKIFLGFQYLIMLLAQMVFFKLLLRNFNFSFYDSALLSLLLGIAILSADGSYINLEVYMCLAVVIAVFLFYGNHIFFSGVLIGISFFLKQYGILNLFPFFLLIYVTKNRRWFNVILFTLGLISTLIVFIFYFVIIQGVPISSILDQLSGIKYIQQVSKKSPSIYSWILGSKVFLIIFIPIVVLLRNRLFSKKNIPWFFGILVNLIPTFLQPFQHYVILTFPYLFILLALNYKSPNTFYFSSILLSGFALAVLLNLRILRYKDLFSRQVYLAKKIENYVPKGSSIYLNGGVRNLYLLNSYDNPLRKRIGYSYFHFLKSKEFDKIDILSNEPIQNFRSKRLFLNDQVFYLKL